MKEKRDEIRPETESALRKFLKSEISTIVFFIGFVSSIIWFCAGIQKNIALMQKDIDLIQTNHLVHVQADIKEIKDGDIVRDTKIDTLGNNIIKIMTKLGIE
jgi:hypothetical protein